MPFKRPTLKELDERIYLDIATRLSGMVRTASEWVRGALLRKEKTSIGVLARAYAGACHMLYAYLDWLAKQRFVHSMDAEFLDAEGGMYDIIRKPAGNATISIVVSGTDGATIPQGALYQTDDGLRYAVVSDATIADGVATVYVHAIDAGIAGNIDAGTMRAVNPVAGTQTDASISGIVSAGVDEESDADYRERILERKRMPPHGGAAHDYIAWAKAVPGVTRAWCLPLWLGEGTVGVMIACDGNNTPIPTDDKIAEVQAYIEKVRPVTAQVHVFAPVAEEITVRVKIDPDTEEIRQAVREEISDWLQRDGAPNGVLYYSRLSEAISAAAGEHHNYIISPTADIQIPINALPVLHDVTFVED